MYTVFTPPADTPVSLADAKAHLRVDHDDEDSLIALMLGGAIDFIENYIGMSLITQTIEEKFDYSGRDYRLSRHRATEVVSFYFVGPDSKAFNEMYDIDNLLISSGEGSALILLDDPPPVNYKVIDKVRIRYKSGFGDTPADVPASIRMAILIQLGSMYENREIKVRRYNSAINDLLREYKYRGNA